MRRPTPHALALLLLALAACGGGGGGGNGDAFVEPVGDVAAVLTRDAGDNSEGLFVVDNTCTSVRSLLGTVPSGVLPDVPTSLIVWNPARTRIAFTADLSATAGRHLYVVDPAVGTPLDLTPGAPVAASIADPAWSPDGTLLAFLGDLELAGRTDLYVVAATGGPIVRVNQPSSLVSPSLAVREFRWRPTGQRLAYVGDMTTNAQFDLFLVDADGTDHVGAARPGAAGADVGTFAWSPTGNRVAFTASLVAAGPEYLYTVLADGTGIVAVGGQPALLPTVGFRWDPSSSSRLAFGRQGSGGSDVGELLRGDPATGASTVVAPAGVPGNPSALPFSFDFATGGALVFSLENALGQADLKVAPLAGAIVPIVGVPTDPSADGVLGFELSPDRSRIAWRAMFDGVTGSIELHVTDADGSDDRVVNAPFPVSGGSVEHVAWAPDSRRIAFSVEDYLDDANDVFVAPAGGGPLVPVSTVTDRVEWIDWTTDAQLVLFRQTPPAASPDIYLAARDGSFTRLLTNLVPDDPIDVLPR